MSSDYIYPARQVISEDEVRNLIRVAKSGQYAYGEFNEEFRKKIQNFLRVRHAVLVNSGSSANLLALSALTSPKLGDRQVKPGDEVIVAACGFPTTLNPVIQLGLVPVFIDVEFGTYVPSYLKTISAVTDSTSVIFLAHTLGNPFEADRLRRFCDERKIWLIEDNCDAFGSKIGDKYTGTFGHLSTLSFYPAHHISTGEGGAVITNSPILKTIVESFRDWGRDCWCNPGQDDTCGKRFEQNFPHLSEGYDHKYIYSHVGYNMKMTNLQAAIGSAQMDKLKMFGAMRRNNFNYFIDRMRQENLDVFFILPEVSEEDDPSWFGIPLTLREYHKKKYLRASLVRYLETNGIGTRQLFGGNLIWHPAYENVEFRISGRLTNSDYIMDNTFWIGCHPGMGTREIDYIISTMKEFYFEKL